MKAALFAIFLSLSVLPAFAGGNQGGNQGGNGGGYQGAPAPLLGVGIPAVIAVGGVLLGAKLLKRKR